jgi:hypothetical protein
MREVNTSAVDENRFGFLNLSQHLRRVVLTDEGSVSGLGS